MLVSRLIEKDIPRPAISQCLVQSSGGQAAVVLLEAERLLRHLSRHFTKHSKTVVQVEHGAIEAAQFAQSGKLLGREASLTNSLGKLKRRFMRSSRKEQSFKISTRI